MMLVMLAYNVTQRQIAGLPNSFNGEGYDIEARSDHPVSYQQQMRMLQTLLADRFKLALHRETKELPVYAMVVAKGGPKLRESPDPGDPLVARGAKAGEQIFKNYPCRVLPSSCPSSWIGRWRIKPGSRGAMISHSRIRGIGWEPVFSKDARSGRIPILPQSSWHYGSNSG